MRKKWTYVAIVSMMLGVAPVFTGCVDTDEPAGLENLRGAKADLLRAKAAVQEALAKVEEANARYRDQETAWLKAKTDYETQVAREKELMNDLLEAQNEIEKQKAEAAYQAYLEELARQKELLDAQLAADLKQAEADMMQAEINLETLRQELELAKISGTEATQAAIAALQADVETAYIKLYGGTLSVTTTTTDSSIWGDQTTTETSTTTVIGAIPEYYYAKKAEQEAMAYQAQGFDCKIVKVMDPKSGIWTGEYEVTPKEEGTDWTGTLAAYVERAQGELEAAQKLLADLETYGDKEVEGTDWKAEVAKLQAEIDKLEQDLSVQLAQLDQAHTTPEYLAAEQAVNGVWKNVGKDKPTGKDAFGEDYKENVNYRKVQVELAGGKTEDQYEVLVEKGAIQILNSAKNKLIAAQKNANDYTFSYEAYQAATPVTDVMKTAIEDAVDALNSKLPTTADPADRYQTPDWEIGFAYAANAKFDWGAKKTSTAEVPATRADEPTEVKTVMDNLNDWIAMVDEATVDPNEEANAQAMIKRAEDKRDNAKKAYEGAYDNWEELVGIVTNEKAHPVSTADFTKSTTNYNNAYKQLNDAIDAWNEAIEVAYTTAEQKVNTDRKLDFMVNAINLHVTAPTGFNESGFKDAWRAIVYNFPSRKTESEFNSLIVESFADGTPNVATVAANFLKELGDYANAQIILNADGRDSDALRAAEDAVTSGTLTYFDAKGEYKGAITTAATAVHNAVWTDSDNATSLNTAIANFNKLAAGYVQLPADSKKQAIHVLIAVPNDKGETSGFENADASLNKYYGSKPDADGKIKYTINVTNITDDEITAATKTKYNNGTNQATGVTYAVEALTKMSRQVFGVDEPRWAPASKDYILGQLEAKKEELGKDSPAYAQYKAMYEASYAAAWFEAEDEVTELQAKIDASKDLQALHDELVAAQAAFKKSIDEQYTANFGELETALAAANTDLAAKQDALDEQEAKFNDIDVAIAKLQAQIAAENELLYTLQTAAWKYLNITWPTESSTDGEGKPVTPETDWSEENGIYEPEEFAEDLQEAIELQKLVVADKEKALALAQAEYDKAAATGYNGVDLATLYVEAAAAKRKTAEEAYTRALEALQRALDVLSGSEAEQPEQPAE